MARISYTIETCRDKISADCTGTFHRIIKKGRPQVNCEPCKAALKAPVRKPRVAKTVVKVEQPAEKTVECPCGKSFVVATTGRGRRPTKCTVCREAGTVYRTNDDGLIEAIRAETLAEEARELREQAGRERAERLVEMMKRLHDRDAKRRLLAA
jgi:hypothetical protein